MQTYAAGTQDGAGAREQDGGGRLEEEEGLFWGCAGELGDVVAVRREVSWVVGWNGGRWVKAYA